MKVEKLVPEVLDEFLFKYQKRTGDVRIANAIADTVWSPDFLGGCCIGPLRTHANTDLRKNFFTAQGCARAADILGGKLNGSTWTELRKVYTKGQKGVRDCPLPAALTVAAAKRVVNEKAEGLIPFEAFSHKSGEGIKFDPRKITKFLLDAYKLSGKAKITNLQMPITYDGAQLTHKTGHVTMGLKITSSF